MRDGPDPKAAAVPEVGQRDPPRAAVEGGVGQPHYLPTLGLHRGMIGETIRPDIVVVRALDGTEVRHG